MNQLSYYYLVLRYPTLRTHIGQCWIHNKSEELLTFIFNLETVSSQTREGKYSTND